MRIINIIVACILLQMVACNAKSDKSNHSGITTPDNGKEIVCFVYHRFGDSRYPSTNVSISKFKAHLNYLKSNDFQVLSLSEAINYLNSNSKPQKTAVITIDDGYKSFIKNGMPLLKEYNFPATLFINTKTVGGNDYMNWEEIKDVSNQGVEIGNHTHSHAYFLNIPETKRYTEFENEIKLSQRLIEEQTGSKPKTFAYPFGELDTKMKEIVGDLDFTAAAAQNSGVIYQGTDLMQLPRFPMSEFYADLDKFSAKAKMKALRILKKEPHASILPMANNRPVLTLNIDSKDLKIDQLNCFVQNNECTTDLNQLGDEIVKLTIKPTNAIDKRRRTLYTITVPDKDGNWHWYSHLWVNPNVK